MKALDGDWFLPFSFRLEILKPHTTTMIGLLVFQCDSEAYSTVTLKPFSLVCTLKTRAVTRWLSQLLFLAPNVVMIYEEVWADLYHSVEII